MTFVIRIELDELGDSVEFQREGGESSTVEFDVFGDIRDPQGGEIESHAKAIRDFARGLS